jgi:Caspase domain
MMTQYALVIGITQNNKPIRTLEQSDTGARKIAEMLENHGDYHRVELLIDPKKTTCKALVDNIRKFVEKTAKGHHALIYYTGHGFQQKNLFGKTETFLAPSDCRWDVDANNEVKFDADGLIEKHENGLPLTLLSELLVDAELSSLVMMLDCCHSGDLLERLVLKKTFSKFSDKNYWLLTACRDFQEALIKSKNEPYSVFTGAVVKGLEPKLSNSQDEEITAVGLFSFVTETLTQGKEKQDAEILARGGRIVIVRHRATSVPTTTVIEDNPYQGLLAFTKDKADLFYGRVMEINTLVNLVQKRNFVPVIGTSGSGKSSLVRAGLIPALEKLAWNVSVDPIKPGSEPLEALYHAVAQLFDAAECEEIYGILEQQRGLELILSRLTPREQKVLLVIDQFEEMFILCQDEEKQQQFINFLIGVMQPANQRLVIVITLRMDFQDKFTELNPAVLIPVISDDKLFLGPLTGKNLEDAISEPAQRHGYKLHQRLLDSIRHDAEGKNCLPLLEFALTELWAKKRDRVKHELTLDAYNELGGLKGTLNLHANKIYREFAANKKEGEWVRRVMLKLVRTTDTDEKDTRQRRPKEELLVMGEDKAAIDTIEKVIAKFENERLLTIKDNIIDLSHEALMEGWEMLRDWRESSRDFRIWHGQLEALMNNGKGNSQQKIEFLSRGLLPDGEKWLKECPKELLKSERRFIKECEKDKNNRQLKRLLEVFLVLGLLVLGWRIFHRYAYCPAWEGLNGERFKDTCFRDLKTSGGKKIFLSGINLDLEKGVEFFKIKNYTSARTRFLQAAQGDRSDPVPVIFANNALALNQDKHLKLAVVTSIDYYEIGAKEVLRGIADAQNKFNIEQIKRGSQHPLMEIEIVNDENDPDIAEKVAKELVNDTNIIGIIGHYASESTVQAEKKFTKITKLQ